MEKRKNATAMGSKGSTFIFSRRRSYNLEKEYESRKFTESKRLLDGINDEVDCECNRLNTTVGKCDYH